MIVDYIDTHRDEFGVEPICRQLQIAPSTYYAHLAKRREPSLRSQRVQRDEVLSVAIQRVFDENQQVYGARKVWKQMLREEISVARCTVERLMGGLGLAGAVRGKRVRTTISNKAAPCPLDRVNRDFKASAPNRLWVSDFTYVATWSGVRHRSRTDGDRCLTLRGFRYRRIRTAHCGLARLPER